MKHEIEINVYDDHVYGFSQYYCINVFKANCDGVITQHRELRCAPLMIRTEHVKGYFEIKVGFFNWYILLGTGKIDGQ